MGSQTRATTLPLHEALNHLVFGQAQLIVKRGGGTLGAARFCADYEPRLNRDRRIRFRSGAAQHHSNTTPMQVWRLGVWSMA